MQKKQNNKLKLITHRDITIVLVSAIAVTICFGLIAGLVGNLQQQLSFAQEIVVEEEVINDTTATTTTPVTSTTTTTTVESILGQVNSTIIAISGLMATAIGIITGIVAWLRAKFGDRVISDDTNAWLQDIFEKIRKKDDDVRDIFRQVLEKSAEIDVVLDVVKQNAPELGAKIDEATPQIQKKLQEIRLKIDHWQAEADKLYEVSPKNDPVGQK